MQDFSDYRMAPQDHRVELIDGREVFSAIAPSSVSNLLQLGYDFYCLQSIDRLPVFLVERLKKTKTLQAARYEVSAAAIMARSGFDIEYLDNTDGHDKQCEFMAIYRDGLGRVGVEAKSRVRDFKINPDEYSYDEDYKGIYNLVRKAKKQGPHSDPFIIFIDVNLPPSAGYSPDSKPWLSSIKQALLPLGEASVDNPDPFSLLIPTNFGPIFSCIDDFSPHGEWGIVVPQYPSVSFPHDNIIRTIWDTIGRYTTIPREV